MLRLLQQAVPPRGAQRVQMADGLSSGCKPSLCQALGGSRGAPGIHAHRVRRIAGAVADDAAAEGDAGRGGPDHNDGATGPSKIYDGVLAISSIPSLCFSDLV